MSYINLVIKGTKLQAKETALRRGITLDIFRESRSKSGYHETFARCDDRHIDVVKSWYDEHPTDVTQPPGALLSWAEIGSLWPQKGA